mgnify:CR=1 FL=1
MIVSRVHGGLGNQMFQYALGRRLALHHGMELLLDLSFFDLKDRTHTPRPFELDVFNVKYRRAEVAELRPFLQARASRIRRVRDRLFPSLANHPSFTEQGFGFDPRALTLPDNIYLDGYWQSENYFKDIEAALRADFTAAGPPNGANTVMADRIRGANAVSIHVRRGDYANDPTTHAHHGLCDHDYYVSAAQQTLRTHPDAAFFIFSDDAAWARENLRFDAPMTVVDHNNGLTSFEDMRLMSLCKHHIIANSSFGWWGAWLNPDPTKMVIAPRQWFRDPGIDTRDLLPATWTRL